MWFLLAAFASAAGPLPEEVACQAGDGAACTVLADAYANAVGVPRDPFRASQLFRQGCELGHAPACMFLAEAYRTGVGTRVDEAQALDLYGKACELGNALACRSVGDLYTMGASGMVDGKAAGVWYKLGCDLGDSQACTAAGLWVERGDSNGVIGESSLSLFEKGCRGHHLRACTLLAERYERGSDGAKKDLSKAYAYYREGCVVPFEPQACRELGMEQLRGDHVSLDVGGGLQNLDRACYQNDAIACRYLGTAQLKYKNESEALVAAERGCDLGDSASCRLAERARFRIMH